MWQEKSFVALAVGVEHEACGAVEMLCGEFLEVDARGCLGAMPHAGADGLNRYAEAVGLGSP